MKKIPDIINRLWNVCGQMEVGALLTCGSGISRDKQKLEDIVRMQEEGGYCHKDKQKLEDIERMQEEGRSC